MIPLLFAGIGAYLIGDSMEDKQVFAEGGEMADGQYSEIAKMKKSLIAKAKAKGLYENFGQKEVRQLEDKYGYTPAISEFDNWAMNFDLSQFAEGGDIETGAASSIKDFVVSYNEHARQNHESTINKGYLMKVAFGENYTNVDSALPMGLLDEMGIGNLEAWHYVMDYNNRGAFGSLTDLFEVIAKKNPTIEVFNEEYEKTDTLPILGAVEKYQNQDILWQFKRNSSQFAKGGKVRKAVKQFNVGDEVSYENSGVFGWEELDEADQAGLVFGETATISFVENGDEPAVKLEGFGDTWIHPNHFDLVKEKFAKGGEVGNLEKELHRLQRELNSSRLSTYTEGDESDEEKARQKEREVKLARFNEVLKLLNEKDSKFAKGGEVKKNAKYLILENGNSMTINEAERDMLISIDAIYKRTGKKNYSVSDTLSFEEIDELLSNQKKDNGGMMAKGGKVGRGKYTYIPNEEIESLTTWNGVEFKGDELLDGSYARGRRKYGEGGMAGSEEEAKKIHSKVLDYLSKHRFSISAFGTDGHSIKVDDKDFEITDQIAIEKIHPKIIISGSTNSNTWYILMPKKI